MAQIYTSYGVRGWPFTLNPLWVGDRQEKGNFPRDTASLSINSCLTAAYCWLLESSLNKTLEFQKIPFNIVRRACCEGTPAFSFATLYRICFSLCFFTGKHKTILVLVYFWFVHTDVHRTCRDKHFSRLHVFHLCMFYKRKRTLTMKENELSHDTRWPPFSLCSDMEHFKVHAVIPIVKCESMGCTSSSVSIGLLISSTLQKNFTGFKKYINITIYLVHLFIYLSFEQGAPTEIKVPFPGGSCNTKVNKIYGYK